MLFYCLFILILVFSLGRYNIGGIFVLPLNIRYFFSCLFVIVVAVFRFNIGFDWSTYYKLIYPQFFAADIVRAYEFFPVCFYFIADYFKQPMLVFILHGLVTQEWQILEFIIFRRYIWCFNDTKIPYI
jgi:hypothetical protein